ncbi:hypothetical protein TPHA_0C01650 [Tetrapisispora phaffii CBS 4417]|uniref:Uncharacterized protein n=1 Tax=Tetrapisispora phaffii (strain ATCC 24235 / CBS 4417 / NBRC 1672 / NRRL Y-8282 / UCD 70-5) TaxID=1071381 RepID=G8BRE5_TETPH|nr:LOW QUALITY PROTEIN: hypothetical protein TPHA_0C01650 [Tetrapisispora phaffii CBS 4417]CCE62321.1 hypothetical protein TPHA_0C01650 [Tetrapisispora phaffii CBS 4417]
MSHTTIQDSLSKKKDHVLDLIGTDQVQKIFGNSDTEAIAFTFSILDLIKKKSALYGTNMNTNSQFYTYSREIDSCKTWCADISLDLNSGFSNTELIEFYWDLIIITELQFILPYYLQNKKYYYKSVNNSIIKKIGKTLTSVINEKKINNSISENYSWRFSGLNYSLIYIPLYFKDFIWGKSDSIYFHVILPRSSDSRESLTEADKVLIKHSKEWLLALLELASDLNLMYMRLYIRRSDIGNISALLKNLNWIGGKLIHNEDRDKLSKNDIDMNEMLFGDEEFLILEFEC